MDDEARWAAVLARDARADGRLYYAVRSTGVVCRPSCPSRRPAREQAVFFERVEDALAAGFRPCRRCRPERSPGELRHHAEVQRACDLIHGDPALPLGAVACEVGLSPRQLQRAFDWWLGISPREYRAACRMSRFKAASAVDATSAALDAGYPSGSGIYEHGGALGMTPSVYRSGARGLEVRYATSVTPLGPAILAATDGGVCALRFGDSRDALRAEVQEEFAGACLVEDSAGLAPWLALVTQYLDGRSRSVTLPLDVHGTLFQLRVWSTLRAIPPGESRTYGEIAAALGHPRAARAVGRACASNPVALAIPCHRVVGSANERGGYRWGMERKQKLLTREAVA
jgi:AraC family transcriptional regulator, regulatory protein of adaptative response / methylated-DNA-[protein]-cysteine methyltransferase